MQQQAHGGRLLRPQPHHPAVTFVELADRRFRGSVHRHTLRPCCLDAVVEFAGKPFGSIHTCAAGPYHHHVGVRRGEGRFADGKLGFRELGCIVGAHMHQGVMLGLIGLDDHPPRRRPTTGTAGHLGQQVKGALGGTKIGEVERHVRQHRSHQRDVGEVVALGQNLRADDQVVTTLADALQHAFQCPFPAQRIAIHAQDTGLGKKPAHLLLDPLGAESDNFHPIGAAGSADRGHGLRIIAMVAAQSLHDLVVDQ